MLTNNGTKVTLNYTSASLYAEGQLWSGLAAREGWGAFISAAKGIMAKGIKLLEGPVTELISGVGCRFVC